MIYHDPRSIFFFTRSILFYKKPLGASPTVHSDHPIYTHEIRVYWNYSQMFILEWLIPKFILESAPEKDDEHCATKLG